MNTSQITAALSLAAALFAAAMPGHMEQLPKITPITEEAYEYKKTDLSELIVDSAVLATVQYDVGAFQAGETVEVLRGSGQKTYHIKKTDGDTTRWVNASALEIPVDPPTNELLLTSEQLERYVNDRDFISDTDFFLWVDIDRQKTYVFQKQNDMWSLFNTFDCATGINAAPTVRGLFSVSDRGKWFYSPQYEQGGKYWVRFEGTYLFHSVPFDEQQTQIVDPTLGTRASHGCVRLSVEESKWIYDNIKRGTTVWVN